MRHVLKASIQTAVLLSLVGVSTGVAGTYYTQRLLQNPPDAAPDGLRPGRFVS
ncbi:MAG: hypothetical protein WCU90_08065 [Kiritimatiellia bacterium]